MSTMLAPRRKAAISAPSLSIVIAAVNGRDVLDATLDSIDALPERARIEVLVVADDLDVAADLRLRQPAVRVVPVAERRPIPRLRYLGVIEAQADLVAILEDHTVVDREWASAMLAAHADPTLGAVGGAVENGKPGLVNWAVFFCEYAPYMRPVAEGPTTDLPGNNIAYKREHLLRHAGILDLGKWESWINDRLLDEGITIASTNRAVVRHIKTFRLGYFLAQRFHFARSYAGMRRVDQSWAKRAVYGLGSAALPILLLSRAARQTIRKGRNLGRFAACLPLLALFFAVGALGEMIGYFAGPGASLDHVE